MVRGTDFFKQLTAEAARGFDGGYSQESYSIVLLAVCMAASPRQTSFYLFRSVVSSALKELRRTR